MRAEISIDVLAIGQAGRGRKAAFARAKAFMRKFFFCDLLPERFAGVAVEAKQDELLDFTWRRPTHSTASSTRSARSGSAGRWAIFAVRTASIRRAVWCGAIRRRTMWPWRARCRSRIGLSCCAFHFFASRKRSLDENLIAPDNWSRIAISRNFDLPLNIA